MHIQQKFGYFSSVQQGISSDAQNHFKRELLKKVPAGFGQGHQKDLQNTDLYKYTHTQILGHDPYEFPMDNKIIIRMTES